MRALSASKLLSVWERAWAEPPGERALALLAAACPERTPDELARLSVGRRDRLLLSLRERTFGPRVVGLVPCGRCSAPVELTFDVADIRAHETDGETGNGGGEAESGGETEALTLRSGDYEVRFRLPNSLDLSAVAACRGVGEGERLMLSRCVLGVTAPTGREATADELPAHAREAVVARMAEADPQADVQLALSCPVCGHDWLAPFDIVSYFWSEINAWAQRILGEVHTLATVYGWRERDILAMSPIRRHLYLDMIGG